MEAYRILAENLIEIDVSIYNSSLSAISKVLPESSGVYSFFKGVPQVKNMTNEQLVDYVISESESAHMCARRGTIPPLFSVEISSQKSMSENKKALLKKFISQKSFRLAIESAFEFREYYQQPLYIGKASNLKSRLCQHFKGETDFYKEMKLSGIDIFNTRILLNVIDGDECTEDMELTLEDLMSRIFTPSFTRRYG